MKDQYIYISNAPETTGVFGFPGMAVPASFAEVNMDIPLPQELHVDAFAGDTCLWSITWKKGDACRYLQELPGGFFIQFDIPELSARPDRMVCRWPEGSFETPCRYHRIYGDCRTPGGDAYLTPIYFCRSGWADSAVVVHTDDNGHYDALIPEGTYRSVIAINHTYATGSLENWSWHMMIDRDEELDFTVGDTEIYSLDLTVSQSMGGCIVFFRPMMLSQVAEHSNISGPVELCGKQFGLIDITVPLTPADLELELNGNPLGIMNMQQVYEAIGETAMPAYILFCEPAKMVGRQTLKLTCHVKGDDGRPAAFGEGRYRFYPGACGSYVK